MEALDWLHLVQIFAGILLPTALLLSILIWSIKNGIVPMPTTPRQKRIMVSCIPQNRSGNIYDLGSGFGSLVFTIAAKHPESRIIGVESSPVPYWTSRIIQWVLRYRNVELRREDIFSASYRDANVIVCYLHRDAVRRLAEKLPDELSPDTVVISNIFAFPGWTPVEILETGDTNRNKIFLYVIGD